MSDAKLCSVDDCDRAIVARGMCRKHYLRAHRARTLDDHPLRDRARHECPPDHPHTHDTCWLEHNCRCERCRHDRQMERQRRRNRLTAYGRTDQIRGERVAAGPVRDHLVALMDHRIGLERIADAAGIPRSVCLDLKFGRRGKRSETSRTVQWVRREYADQLLALTADDIERALIDSVGTSRRLQALVAIGWTETQLAERMSMGVANFWRIVCGMRHRVTAAMAARAAEIFAELWDQPQTGTYADQARRIAERRDWRSPLAWDDIDSDPTPAVVDEPQRIAKADVFLEDVEFLLDAGEAPEQVAIILGRKPDAIAKLAERHDRLDLARHFWSTKRQAAA